jgi:hypothetical protein
MTAATGTEIRTPPARLSAQSASLARRICADGIQGWSFSARASGGRRFHLSESQRIGDKDIDHVQVHAASVHARGSWTHVLGTDQLGRDLFVRTLIGLQNALTISLCAVVIMFTVGAARDTLVQALSEPVTGNWDPTSHTILPQHYMELLVMGQLFRMPLRREDPSAVIWELATGQKLNEFYTIEYALRDS